MNEIIITLATVPAIIALVTLAKDLGVPSRLAPLLAVFLGVALTLFDALASGLVLDMPGLLSAIGTGIILGLSASGLYDGASIIGKKRAQEPEPVTRGDHAASAETTDDDMNALFKL